MSDHATLENLRYIEACFSRQQIEEALRRIRTPLQDVQDNFIWRGTRNRRAVILMKGDGAPADYIAKVLGISEGRVNTIWYQERWRRRVEAEGE